MDLKLASSRLPMGVGTMNNFTMSKMRYLVLSFLLAISSCILSAQEAQEEPAQVVLNLLSGKVPLNRDSIETCLKAHSWESLAYWDSGLELSKSNLFEAVPDVYRFDDTGFQLLLFSEDPANRQPIKGGYVIKEDQLEFVKKRTNEVIDTWTILYVDRNYLAVDMDGLRVFLVPPDNDPF